MYLLERKMLVQHITGESKYGSGSLGTRARTVARTALYWQIDALRGLPKGISGPKVYTEPKLSSSYMSRIECSPSP
jgi:hypothetical protein